MDRDQYQDFDDDIAFLPPPMASSRPNDKSDALFASFEADLSRQREDKDRKKRKRDDREEKRSHKHDKDKKHKHHSDSKKSKKDKKDKRHKESHRHKRRKIETGDSESLSGSESSSSRDDILESYPSEPLEKELLKPLNRNESVLPTGDFMKPSLDSTITEKQSQVKTNDYDEASLISTDWMTKPPPPSSWRKKTESDVTSFADTTQKSSKKALELNVDVNPESTWRSKGNFTVGDGGKSWKSLTSGNNRVGGDDDRREQHPSDRRANYEYTSQTSTSQTSSQSSTQQPSAASRRWKKSADEPSVTQSKIQQETSAYQQQLEKVLVSRTPAVSPADEELMSIDLNKLNSQILKANMTGKKELAAELKAKLEKAKALQQQSKANADDGKSGSHIKIIEDLDEYGRSRSATVGQLSGRLSSQYDDRSNPRTSGLHSEGKRSMYFADDNDLDLNDLVARERLSKGGPGASAVSGSGIQNMDRHYAENVMRKRNYNESQMFEKHYDGDGDVDYQQWESRENKMSQEKLQQRDRQRAIHSQQRMDKVTSNCYYCFENRRVPSHLIISLGEHTSLIFPEKGQLTPYHCLIVPNEHVLSMTTMEDAIFAEVQNFMKSLTKLFASMGKEAIFIETVLDFKSRRHTTIECIPINKKDADMAPLYFQKAIQESESEWSTHKKLYEFKIPQKTIKNVIAAQFAYFVVQFGMDMGFAHHIEEKQRFSPTFGREVIAGMLQLPLETYIIRPKRKPLEEEKKQVLAFLDLWKPYDWTIALDGGSY